MVAELEYVVKTTKFSIERKRLDLVDYPYVLEEFKTIRVDVKNNIQQTGNIDKKIAINVLRNEPNKRGNAVINSNASFSVNANSNIIPIVTKKITIPVGISYDDTPFLIEDSEIQFFKKVKLMFNTYIAGESIYTTPGTYIWTAPAGVTSVNVVCIGGGGVGSQSTNRDGQASWFIDSTSLNGGGGRGWQGQFSSFSGLGGSSTGTLRTGGFEGGNGTSPNPGNPDLSRSGGGGAGGYTQAGGNGGKSTSGGSYGGGGGVGIYGGTVGGNGGPAGRGGAGGSGGTDGELNAGGLYGGGGPSHTNSAGHAGGGGGLAYGNNISVTPGNTYNLQVGEGGLTGIGGNGAVRIIWGDPSVAFPSNASASAVDNTIVVQDLNIESEYLYFKEENPKETYTKTIMSGKKNIDPPQTIVDSEVSLFTNRKTNIPLIVTDDQNNFQITRNASSFTMTTFIPTVVTIRAIDKIKWGLFINDGIPQYRVITDENDPNLVVTPSTPSTDPVQIWY